MTAPTDERYNYELSVLNEIAQALNRSVDLDAALNSTLAYVAQLFELETGWIWLLNEETGNTYLAAAQNLPPALAYNPERMEGSCYCLDTYRDGDLGGAANVNIITCSRLKNLLAETDGLRFHASIPLYAHGRQLGILNVASTDWRQLAPEDLRLLHTVGDLLSIAVERARLFARSAEVGAVNERNRLAREIHDTLAQGLAAIALQMEAADALLDAGGDPERVQAVVRQALTLARTNLEEARCSVMDLRAAPLEGLTLVEALMRLADEFNASEAFHCSLNVVGGDHPLPSAIEAGLFRVVQETLANVRGHAHAQFVTLSLHITPARLSLTVQDDGDGFDPGQIPTGRFGLTGINERVRLLDGELKIESAPGKGAKISATIPLMHDTA